MISTDRLKDIGKIPVFPCTVGWSNYVPTGTGTSQNTVLVLGAEDTAWNGVEPEKLNNLLIKSVALDGSDYSKLVLKSELGTSYFELSEEAVGVTKGVFINLGDLATTGNAYVQLREIEYNDGTDGYKAWVLASEPILAVSGQSSTSPVLLGKLVGSFTSGNAGSSITLQPCDGNGITLQDNASPPADLPTVSVYLPWDLDMTTAQVGGTGVPVTCMFETDDIFEYSLDQSLKAWLIGTFPTQIIGECAYDPSQHAIVVSVCFLAGSNRSTWSDFIVAIQFYSEATGQYIRYNSTDKKFETVVSYAYLPEAPWTDNDWTPLATGVESLKTPCTTPGS